jgi:hypothetical protein
VYLFLKKMRPSKIECHPLLSPETLAVATALVFLAWKAGKIPILPAPSESTITAGQTTLNINPAANF